MNKRAKLLLAATILCATGLTACGPKRIETVLPPASLLECKDEPLAPALPDREQQIERDRMTLDYILALRSAWGDCAAKVMSLREWAESMKD